MNALILNRAACRIRQCSQLIVVLQRPMLTRVYTVRLLGLGFYRTNARSDKTMDFHEPTLNFSNFP